MTPKIPIPCPHWDYQLAHTSERVSILIGVIILYALAKLQHFHMGEIIISKMKNSYRFATNFRKRCIFLIERDSSCYPRPTTGPSVGMVWLNLHPWPTYNLTLTSTFEDAPPAIGNFLNACNSFLQLRLGLGHPHLGVAYPNARWQWDTFLIWEYLEIVGSYFCMGSLM